MMRRLRARLPDERVTYCLQTNGTLLDEDWCTLFAENGVPFVDELYMRRGTTEIAERANATHAADRRDSLGAEPERRSEELKHPPAGGRPRSAQQPPRTSAQSAGKFAS